MFLSCTLKERVSETIAFDRSTQMYLNIKLLKNVKFYISKIINFLWKGQSFSWATFTNRRTYFNHWNERKSDYIQYWEKIIVKNVALHRANSDELLRRFPDGIILFSRMKSSLRTDKTRNLFEESPYRRFCNWLHTKRKSRACFDDYCWISFLMFHGHINISSHCWLWIAPNQWSYREPCLTAVGHRIKWHTL